MLYERLDGKTAFHAAAGIPPELQSLSCSFTSTRPRPIPNSYWATPLLLGCEYPWTPQTPDSPKLDALLRAGVRMFIDLTESGELLPYSDVLLARAASLGISEGSIEYHRFPIRDRSLPPSVEHMRAIMDVLKDNQKRGRITAVHCRGGIGRTGMVVGCWLIESGVSKDGKEALDRIANEWKTVEKCKRFPHSPETGAQCDFVLQFQAGSKRTRFVAYAWIPSWLRAFVSLHYCQYSLSSAASGFSS